MSCIAMAPVTTTLNNPLIARKRRKRILRDNRLKSPNVAAIDPSTSNRQNIAAEVSHNPFTMNNNCLTRDYNAVKSSVRLSHMMMKSPPPSNLAVHDYRITNSIPVMETKDALSDQNHHCYPEMTSDVITVTIPTDSNIVSWMTTSSEPSRDVRSSLLKRNFPRRYEPETPMSKEKATVWRREERKKRNRESAAASRHRIRDRISELELEVSYWKEKYEEAVKKLSCLERQRKETRTSPTRDEIQVSRSNEQVIESQRWYSIPASISMTTTRPPSPCLCTSPVVTFKDGLKNCVLETMQLLNEVKEELHVYEEDEAFLEFVNNAISDLSA